uniref:PPM-type phosphatase domain-containing protein n=1 Tax=Lygus hesperus TaxID=30085 RepID=A0A0A9XU39_LYGHE
METDNQLLQYCTQHDYAYTACTSVTVFLHIPSQTLYVAHLADSHAVVGMPTASFYAARNATKSVVESTNVAVVPTTSGGDDGGDYKSTKSIPYTMGISKTLYVPNTHVSNEMAESLATVVRNVRSPVKLHASAIPRGYAFPYVGQFLTSPHRPDDPNELRRIRESGGELVYLHRKKPFIRGGDFNDRKMAMQLNYSRAFGGRDLKMYGLSCEPDIRAVDVRLPAVDNTISKPEQTLPGEDIRMVILGSDGLWDVVTPMDAVNASSILLSTYGDILQSRDSATAADAISDGSTTLALCSTTTSRGVRPQSPSEFLVQTALHNHCIKGSNDNVTCIIVYF